MMDDLIFSILNKPNKPAQFMPTKQLFTTKQITDYGKALSSVDRIEFLGGLIINPNLMDRTMVPVTEQLLCACLKKWYFTLQSDTQFHKEDDYEKSVGSLGTYRFHRGGRKFMKSYDKYKIMRNERKKHYEQHLPLETVEKLCTYYLINRANAYKCPILTTDKEINSLKRVWKNSLTSKPKLNFRKLYNSPNMLFENLLYTRSQYTDNACPATFYTKYHVKHGMEMDHAKCGTLVAEDVITEAEPKNIWKEGDLYVSPNPKEPGMFRLDKEMAEYFNELELESSDDSDQEDEEPARSVLEATMDKVNEFAKKMQKQKSSNSNNF